MCPEYDPSRNPTAKNISLQSEHKLTDAFRQTTVLTDLSPRLFFDRDGVRAALYYPDGVIEIFLLEGDGSVASQLGQLTREVRERGKNR